MLKCAITFTLLFAGVFTHAQMVMSARTLIEAEQQHGSSGTSIEPASTPVSMLMTDRDGWSLMLHGNAFAANTQQQADSERGRDAFFSTNWIMPMAQRALGADGHGGELSMRAMFSIEPATVGDRNYPEPFQQGETAYGNPIVDGQHPHDFFMEVAALYDLPLSPHTLLSFYAAPIGDPAIGPTAFPHRQSASEDPIAALGHHQEDSTHIAFNVLTGGLTYRFARIELSGFHGGEPDEHRWALQPSPNGHAVDSYSTRLTIAPTPDLTGQYSIAHITSPEALYPGENQQRQTASVMYHHTFSSKHEADGAKPMPNMNMLGMKMDDMPGMSGDAEQQKGGLPATRCIRCTWPPSRALTSRPPSCGDARARLRTTARRTATSPRRCSATTPTTISGRAWKTLVARTSSFSRLARRCRQTSSSCPSAT